MKRRTTILLVTTAAVAVLGGGGWLALSARAAQDKPAAPARQVPTGGTKDLYAADRGSFDMVIPVTGELAASRQIEVRNKMEGRAIITEIVAEGKSVKKGDVLLKLSEDEILNKIKDAEDKSQSDESSFIASEQAIAIRENQKQSEIEKAELAVELAKLALEAWEKGEVVSKRETLRTALETAQIDKERLDRRFEEAKNLVTKGYISRDDYEKDRMAKIQGDAKVKQCQLDVNVYEQFQYKQDRAKKESDLEQAIAERKRVEQRADAELTKLRAESGSAKFKAQSAKERLEQLKVQHGYCLVVAPTDGLIVYATSMDSGGGMGGRGGGDAQPPQVGTELKPNELVMVLPDTSTMMANLKVSEALSGRVKKEQPVTVWSDAMPNLPLAGKVVGVSVLAEAGGWRDPNRRDYTVKVVLDVDPKLGLKPSMRCKAEILLDRVTDALSVPIQAVFRQGPVSYVYVPDGEGFAQRQVKLGRASELEVEILSGLEAGDQVLLREPKKDEVTAVIDMEKVAAAAGAPGAAGADPGGPPAGGAAPPGVKRGGKAKPDQG
jgi:multidrug resistance efflux pump